MIKRAIGAMAMLAAVGLVTPALAQAPDAPKPATPAPGMQRPMHQGGMAKGTMARHHRRSCFDAAWQSEEWKRCEAMMEQRHGRR